MSELSILNGSPLPLLVSVTALSLIPFALLGATSYLKLSVVFGILRNAIGMQQIPSGALSSLLAFVLTLHIMAPVFRQMEGELAGLSNMKQAVTLGTLLHAAGKAKAPLVAFLTVHSRTKERAFFAGVPLERVESLQCENAEFACLLPEEGIPSLLPAFVLSELASAFAIGFVLFLPFLVIDLVVANLLVGMGLTMMSPVTLALPLKVLLFVGCDAWFHLSRALVMSYGGQ